MISLYDSIGLVGVSLSVGCYARVQWQRDFAKSFAYSLLNFLSAVLLAVSIFNNWNIAAFVSNTIWGALSAYGMYRCWNYMRRAKKAAQITLH